MQIWTKRAAAVGLALVTGALPLSAQQRSTLDQDNNIRYGTAAAEWLLIPVGARATALGSAFSSLSTDVTAMYWNPAGLSMLTGGSAALSAMEYVADTRSLWFGVATPFGSGQQSVGLSIGTFGFDDQPRYTVDQPNGTGQTYGVSNAVIGVTYGQRFNDRFSFGLTGKYVSESLADATASALALDIGTLYQTELGGRTIRGSFVINNLGGNLEHSGSNLQVDVPVNDPLLPSGTTRAVELRTKGWSLPVSFKVGVAYDVISSASSRLTTAGEFWQPTGNDVMGALGAEYALMNIAESGFSVAARAGFNYDPSNYDVAGSDMNGMQGEGLSLGGGVGYAFSEARMAGVDYAYRNMGLLGGRHMFSLSLGW